MGNRKWQLAPYRPLHNVHVCIACVWVCNRARVWTRLSALFFHFFFFFLGLFFYATQTHTNTVLWMAIQNARTLLFPNRNWKIIREEKNPSDWGVEKKNCISGRDTQLKLVACGLILYWKMCGQIWSGWFRTISESFSNVGGGGGKSYHDNWKTFIQYW